MRYRSLVFLGLLILGSCLNSKDYDLNSVSVTPTVAVPLASGRLSLVDLIADKDSGYVKQYSDGLLYFSYQKTLASQGIRQFFNFQDKNFSASIDLPAATLPPSNSDFRSDSVVQALDLNLSPEQLSEMGFKSGNMNYTVSTSPSLPSLSYAINLIFTDITDNTSGKPLNITSSTGSGSKSLLNNKVILDRNKFNVRIVLILKQRNNTQFIPPGAKVNIQMTMASPVASFVRGFFGDRSVALPTQNLDLTVFSNSLKKSPVTVIAPSVKLLLSNDNGVPTELTFSSLEAKKTGASLPIQISPSSPVTMSYPSTLGSSANTPVSVGNSSDLINFLPTQMSYTANVRINKGLSSGNNFLADTSKLRITLAAEVPLYGRATGMIMSDTMKIDLGGVNESNLTSAKLKIKAVNQLPLDAYIQLYLTDKNYVILDSLLTTNQTYFVKGSTVAGSGDLQTAGTSDSMLDLSQTKINKLFTSSYLIIKAKLNTSKDTNGSLLNVKFKASYTLDLKVGLYAQLNLTAK